MEVVNQCYSSCNKDNYFYYMQNKKNAFEKIKKEIWRTGDTMFYKQGVSDPDYCVLKFTAVKGRYYCDLKSKSFTVEELT